MANLNSTYITNRDATPRTVNSSNGGAPTNGGLSFGQVAVTTSEVSTNILRLLSVPSNARHSQCRLYSTALGGTCAGNIGFYRNTSDGGAAVSASLLGAAVSLVSAVAGVEQAGTLTIAQRAQPLWQVLGFTSDPRTTFDVCITLTANVSSAGNVGIEYAFVQ